jgi:hypothetical protein
MRPILLFASASLSLSAFAAQPESPAKVEPPAPPAMTIDEGAEELPVKITQQPDTTVEEYRVGGLLYMIKITPKYGPPYYLVDDRGDGKFARQESLDSGFRVPRWIIKRF